MLECSRATLVTWAQMVEAETRERLQIWNVSQDLLVVAALDGTYLSVNPAWTATLGWSTSDLIGKTSQWLLHPDDREKTRAEISRLAVGKTISRFENRFRNKEGSYRWISWKAVPDQERIYAMGRDVTDLKDAENTLQETREELVQVAQRTMIATMSAAIAHEIKQPLAAIVTNANAGLRWLNRATPDLDEARVTLEDIAASAHRANEVIQSVRGMIAKTDQALTSLDTSELIRETIALVRGDLDAAGIVVQLELAAQLPLIAAHKGRLKQVILNLVTNAANAMRAVTNRGRVLTVNCNAVHDAPARLCLWLLQTSDRIGNDTLPLTQELIAQMLGVRRTTVTIMAQSLQSQGAIKYMRGRISILDREKLEHCACECYAILQQEKLPLKIGVKL
jgi:PAS domain S-box-containing protein